MSKTSLKIQEHFLGEKGVCRICGGESDDLENGVCPKCRELVEESESIIKDSVKSKEHYSVDDIINILAISVTSGKSYEEVSKETGVPLKLLYEWDSQIFGKDFSMFVEFQKRILIARMYSFLNNSMDDIIKSTIDQKTKVLLMRTILTNLPKMQVGSFDKKEKSSDDLDDEIKELEEDLQIKKKRS